MSACASASTDLGIDVVAKQRDIRRIVLKYFAVRGVDPEELVQEVVLGILERNRLPGSAYDPGRGAFSTYVFRVAQNVAARLANRQAKQARAAAVSEEHPRPEAAAVTGLPSAEAWEPVADEDGVPPDWRPTAEHMARARALGLDAIVEADAMRAQAAGVAFTRNTMGDWDRRFVAWLDHAVRARRGRGNPAQLSLFAGLDIPGRNAAKTYLLP